MAISPSSDVVLGVALAADPDKYRVATERLQRLSATAAAGLDPQASGWQTSVAAQPSDAPQRTGSMRGYPTAGMPAAGAPGQGRTASSSDAFGQLEAFVLQTFIQSMLPKNATHVFGKGTAGEVWKSMLAEKLAGEIARSGQMGIAKSLQSGSVARGSITHIPGAATVPASPSLASILPYLQPAALASPTAEKAKS